MNTRENLSRVGIAAILASFALLLTVSPAAGQNPPAGQVFSDDAERAIMENWVLNSWTIAEGSPAVSQTEVHSGKYSYVFPSGSISYWSDALTFPDPLYEKAWFYVPSTYSLGSGSVAHIVGLLNLSGLASFQISLTNNGGSLYTYLNGSTGTHAVATNEWHTVEMEYYVAGGTLTLWLDGVQDIAQTGQTLATYNSVYLGLTAGTGSVYLDDITVGASASGTPTSGLTVRHAYPTNRLAMKVKSYIWGAASTDQLVSSVDGTTFSTISNPGTYQEPILTMTGLSAGNHTLQVQLQTSGGTVRQTWTETIVACGCTPTNGIDAYNNVVRGGNKVLPISAWAMNQDNATLWLGYGTPSSSNMSPPGINASGWWSGYSASYSVSQYQTFMEGAVSGFAGLNCLNENNLPVVGPYFLRMGGFGTAGTPSGDAANMAGY